MSIAAYCRRPACTASPGDTLLAAAQRMEKERIGLLVVTEGEDERVAGVLSDRDLALYVAADGHRASRARIADAMTRQPVVVETDLSLEEALGRMHRNRVRRLPVVDGKERLTGLVTADDLLHLLAREIAGLGEVLAAQLPAGAARALGHEAPQEPPRRLAEHYTREVVTSRSAASIVAVARSMQDSGVGSVVVLGEDDAVGLVTDRDIALRVVAAGLDPQKTAASAVMSAPLIAAAPKDPLEEVVARMRTASIRRIPILRDGLPAGMVSFDDLLVAFGRELEQLAGCVDREIRSARIQSVPGRIRRELEDRIEETATQLRQLGDQTLRALSGELEQVVDRLFRLGRPAPEAAAPEELRVRDLMQPDVRFCMPEDALSEPARIMWERDCGCVPVVSSDGSRRVVGMITDRDLCMASYMKGRRLAEMQVAEVMSDRVHTCRTDDPVSEAVHVMQSRQVRRLPVVDARGRLRGLLSLADVAEAAIGRRAPAGAVDEAAVAHTLEAICRPRSEVVRADA